MASLRIFWCLSQVVISEAHSVINFNGFSLVHKPAEWRFINEALINIKATVSMGHTRIASWELKWHDALKEVILLLCNDDEYL